MEEDAVPSLSDLEELTLHSIDMLIEGVEAQHRAGNLVQARNSPHYPFEFAYRWLVTHSEVLGAPMECRQDADDWLWRCFGVTNEDAGVAPARYRAAVKLAEAHLRELGYA